MVTGNVNAGQNEIVLLSEAYAESYGLFQSAAVKNLRRNRQNDAAAG